MAFIRAAIHRKAAKTQEDADLNALVSDFGYLAVNTTTRDFDPSESNMTFARLVLAASTNDPVPEPKTTILPPEPIARALVEYYVTNILYLYPAFPASSLQALVNDLYQEHPRVIRSAEYWLFWMVLAVGSAAQSRRQQDDHYSNAVEFVGRALPHADQALKPGYVTQVRSLLLLAQYSMLDPAHFDSWHPIGFACRAVIDQGLHQDPPQGQQMDQDALDARRRTFYCVYALDRATSIVLARAFSFYDDAASVSLPLSNDPTIPGPTAKPLPDASIPLFRLRQLQSDWYQTLRQSDPANTPPDPIPYIWQKYFEMWTWAERLPTDLPVAVREMLDLELRYSYVYLIASATRATPISPHGRLLIREHVIAYIERIHEVASGGANWAFYTYHDALRVFFMGSQLVAVVGDGSDLLVSPASIPVPVAEPGKVGPPPLPPRVDGNAGDETGRCLECLNRVKLTLKVYGARWGGALSLMESFEMVSGGLLETLTQKRMLRGGGWGQWQTLATQ
ncbi:hypothetical protein N0V88_003262 [Collariella sp. IMI 366227]|nr:hypothetical protein N0V88_003262 [Collariella sp. IMI 366227]